MPRRQHAGHEADEDRNRLRNSRVKRRKRDRQARHGEAGFWTFSHARSVFHQSRFNGAGMTKPPYGGRMNRLLSLLLR